MWRHRERRGKKIIIPGELFGSRRQASAGQRNPRAAGHRRKARDGRPGRRGGRGNSARARDRRVQGAGVEAHRDHLRAERPAGLPTEARGQLGGAMGTRGGARDGARLAGRGGGCRGDGHGSPRDRGVLARGHRDRAEGDPRGAASRRARSRRAGLSRGRRDGVTRGRRRRPPGVGQDVRPERGRLLLLQPRDARDDVGRTRPIRREDHAPSRHRGQRASQAKAGPGPPGGPGRRRGRGGRRGCPPGCRRCRRCRRVRPRHRGGDARRRQGVRVRGRPRGVERDADGDGGGASVARRGRGGVARERSARHHRGRRRETEQEGGA